MSKPKKPLGPPVTLPERAFLLGIDAGEKRSGWALYCARNEVMLEGGDEDNDALLERIERCRYTGNVLCLEAMH